MTNKEFKDKFLIHRKLVTYILKSKYALSNEEAEDIVQNAYVKIYKRFRNNKLVCEYPKKYLLNAAVNCTIEYKTRKAYLKNESSLVKGVCWRGDYKSIYNPSSKYIIWF